VRNHLLSRLSATAIVTIAIFLTIPAKAQSISGYGRVTFNAGSNPTIAKVGDLDGDGLNDIAVVNQQGSLQIFYNSGGGSFQQVSMNNLWPSNSQALGLDIGDINGDGKNDIVAAFTSANGTVSVLRNLGGRTFAPPVNYDVCSSSNSVAIGDLDRDGDNDLAVTGLCSKAAVLLNTSTGVFSVGGSFGSGSSTKAIALADFNRDGWLDIAFLNATTGGRVVVLLNQKNGTFAFHISLFAGDLPYDFTVGDFDGDGSPDIAISNNYLGEVIVLFNDLAGNFTTGYFEAESAGYPTGIVTGDFNGDGRRDIAFADGGFMNTVKVMLNQGNYMFSSFVDLPGGQAAIELAAGRLDSDLLTDLVTVNQTAGTITVLLSTRPQPPPPPPPAPITLTATMRRVGPNGFVDLKWSGAPGSTVEILRNNARIATVPNNGNYTDSLGKVRGTFKYNVCSREVCSNSVIVTF
jgi:hypothetical protein